MNNSLIMLWKVLAEELASWCRINATRDHETVVRRVEHEGLSFLTITLPDFCTSFQKALAQGQVDRNLFAGFSRKGELPRFLGGFLDLVFDRSSGTILDEPCVDAIRAVRQLTLVYGKILLDTTLVRKENAFAGFVANESYVKEFDAKRGHVMYSDFARVSSLLFSGIFSVLDDEVFDGTIIPRHGPGATADGQLGNAKFDCRSWTQRLEAMFPSGNYLIPNWSFVDQLERVTYNSPRDEIPMKVISVPKTLKTPRIIAKEPTCMMFMQQAISQRLVELIGEHRLLSEQIGFADQPVNQELAREGSIYGHLATLDLSDASDCVSNQLVREMLAPHPYLAMGVDACRTRKADVPGHGIRRLAKFAPMGSALCFPVEAIVFTTLVYIGIEKCLGRKLTLDDVKSCKGVVRCYGDDIIVPTAYVHSVVETLEAFGLKVNRHKSFWTGGFRESCGADWFKGSDVTPVRLRKPVPSTRRDVREIIGLVAFRNQLYTGGYWQTCSFLDRHIENLIHLFPCVVEGSRGLGRLSYLGYKAERDCPILHRPLVKAYVVVSQIPPSKLTGSGALLKCLLKRGDEPFADSRHLERSGRPRVVDIKPRWVTPF